jgi:hypothetical protein
MVQSLYGKHPSTSYLLLLLLIGIAASCCYYKSSRKLLGQSAINNQSIHQSMLSDAAASAPPAPRPPAAASAAGVAAALACKHAAGMRTDCMYTFDVSCCDKPEPGVERFAGGLCTFVQQGGPYSEMARYVGSWKGMSFSACYAKAVVQCYTGTKELSALYDECCRAAHNLCGSC